MILVESQCQGPGYSLATRDDGQLICYYYINDLSGMADDDNYLNYEQSKQICEQRGKS